MISPARGRVEHSIAARDSMARDSINAGCSYYAMRLSASIASLSPCAAAFRNHFIASAKSVPTTLPSA